MTDNLTSAQRKYNMSRIKSKNTKLELRLRKLLWRNGVRGYRIHYPLLGKPDIVFIKKKIVIFIDGCFWHKCPLDFTQPKTNIDFWMNKIEKNVLRDNKITIELEKNGWTVLRFWEHQIIKQPNEVLKKILIHLS